MKRLLSILLLISMITALASCDKNISNETNTSNTTMPIVETTTQAETTVVGKEPTTPAEKVSAADFAALMNEKYPDENYTDHDFVEITPANVPNNGGVQLFEHTEDHVTFLLSNGEIKPLESLVTSFGGWGLHNFIPCDFDGDGNLDILMASSWGSGIHRTELSIFNTATGESTVFGIYYGKDLIFGTSSENLPNDYPVYEIELDLQNYSFDRFDEYIINDAYIVVDTVCTIVSGNSTPIISFFD